MTLNTALCKLNLQSDVQYHFQTTEKVIQKLEKITLTILKEQNIQDIIIRRFLPHFSIIKGTNILPDNWQHNITIIDKLGSIDDPAMSNILPENSTIVMIPLHCKNIFAQISTIKALLLLLSVNKSFQSLVFVELWYSFFDAINSSISSDLSSCFKTFFNDVSSSKNYTKLLDKVGAKTKENIF